MSEKRDKLRFKVFLTSVVNHSVLGTCDRLRASCGIVKEKCLRGVGYNGSLSGLPHCDDVGHIMEGGHCLATRHAEDNSITNTGREFLQGGTAIMPFAPCLDCLKDLAAAGITRIDYVSEYGNNRGQEHRDDILRRKNIIIQRHNIDWQEIYQEIFDLMAREGGVLHHAGYRLKVIKEKL